MTYRFAIGSRSGTCNGVLKEKGISRWSKWRALNELERLGLITVERRKRKSPIIRLIVEDKPGS
jgi:hypothetical protein